MALSHPSFDGPLGFALVLCVIGAVIGFIDNHLTGWLVVFGFAFNTLVLFFCLGPQSFYEETKLFLSACRDNDKDSAAWYAEQLLGRPLKTNEKENLVHTVTEELLVMVNERLLGVVFWFFVLGPVGAWMYRGTQQLLVMDVDETPGLQSFAQKAFYIVNWPTARLVSFTYLLAGNYVGGYKRFKSMLTSEQHDDIETRNGRLVAESGLGAIDSVQAIGAVPDINSVELALTLARRAVTFWLGIIAVLTLLGWG